MIEKCKESLKNNFSNGPKAKIMLSVIVVAIIATVIVTSLRKTVTIVLDGNEVKVVTFKGTVKDLLQDEGIEVTEKDKVQPALEDKLSEDDMITIKKAVEVQLVTMDKEIVIQTAEDTVEEMLEAEFEALKSQGIEFKKGIDEVEPSLNTEIQKNLEITLVKVEEVNEVAVQPIDFDVVTEEDNSLDINVEEVRQDGVTGEKEITYRVLKKDGKEVLREVISSKVTKEPVEQIIVQGTRRTFASRNGEVLDYKQLLYCESTAYTGGGITATGTTPVYNPGGISTIAVDPRVIPLGSLVYVEGYGKAIAADTGGAIQGNIIDIYVDTYEQAVDWGRKHGLSVYILAYPGEW